MNKTTKIVLIVLLIFCLAVGAVWFWKHYFAPPSDNLYQVYFTDIGEQNNPMDTRFCQFLDSARQTIDLALFDVDLACVETTLLQAAKKGVKVRMVTDYDNITPVIKALQKNIPILFDQRRAFMHNKFVIVDHHKSWTGSFNATDNGTHKNNNNAIMIDSPELAQNYTLEFEEMFVRNEFGPKSTANTPHPIIDLNGIKVENYFSPEDDVRSHIITALQTAQKSVYFMAFSFTDNDIGQILSDLSQKGVQVSGLVEKVGSSSKHSQFRKLKQNNISLRVDGNPGVMHHKVFIIDEKTVITGSYNFSQNAARTNDENILILHSSQIAIQYLKEFKKLYSLGS